VAVVHGGCAWQSQGAPQKWQAFALWSMHQLYQWSKLFNITNDAVKHLLHAQQELQQE
jgi:hypothetical protein